MPDDRAQETIEAIIGSAPTGKIGDGRVFVSEVGAAVRVCNSETDEEALLRRTPRMR